MRFIIDCQVVDRATGAGLDLDADELAELIEAAICDLGQFKTVDSQGESHTAGFVNVEVSPAEHSTAPMTG